MDTDAEDSEGGVNDGDNATADGAGGGAEEADMGGSRRARGKASACS
jgi:hypothetical protein